MDATISDLDVEIALGKAAGEARPDAKPHVMTAQEIAIRDPAMEQLLEQKSASGEQEDHVVRARRPGAEAPRDGGR